MDKRTLRRRTDPAYREQQNEAARARYARRSKERPEGWVCPKCGGTEVYKNGQCAPCGLATVKAHRLTTKGSATAKRLEEKRLADPIRSLLRGARKRATDLGISFDLTKEDIVIPEFCPLLGIRLQREKGYPGRGSPSLDRIDPAAGYVKGNVWVISLRANTMKNDASLAELKMLVERLERRMTKGHVPFLVKGF